MKKSIFKNCLSVHIEDGASYPVRFTPKQLAFYENYSDTAFARALCSAGVQMEFTTTAKTVAFSCNTSHFVRQFCTFDFYEDDVFMFSRTFTGAPGSVELVYERKRAGTSKITVHLPYTCRTGIRGFDFEHEPTPDIESPKILACGDSITQNMTTEHPSISFTSLLAKHFDAALLNQGVGGFIFCKDSLDDALDYSPNLVMVAYGTNDLALLENTSEIERNAADYIARLKSIFKAARICVISPIWREVFFDAAEKESRFISLSAALADMCAKQGVDFIDGASLVPNMPDFFVDGTHPNARGFALYALNLIKRLKQQ